MAVNPVRHVLPDPSHFRAGRSRVPTKEGYVFRRRDRAGSPHPVSRPPGRRSAARRSLVFATGAVLAVLAGLLAPAAAVAGQPPTAKAAKPAPISKAVQSTLAAKGSADVWLVFSQRADLKQAAKVKDWDARGAAVVKALQATATKSQARAKSTLKARRADYTAYWAANRILVRGATSSLTRTLAALPGVQKITEPRTWKLPPAKKVNGKKVDAVEWGVAAIKADRVWSDYGVRGEGITVANVDTGVQYDHPALVGKYRGNRGDGTFDHNYNWFDPANVCGSPSTAPCDNVGHGTHTMGTMVGDDGNGNEVGVAPGANWIAAKGCESDSCSDTSLLGAGQWTLAPTDLSGANPRPDLRPNVVNNSWGGSNGSGVDPWFDEIVQAWTAGGQFAVFSNGNDGPGCDTTGSPADSPYAFGVGAFNEAGQIADFSSRGPGANGEIRPNVSAPGENVRSSVPGNGYDYYSGTSMAAPHVAGTVALLWSAAPALAGDIDATRALLNETAVDVDDQTCGGTAGNNNVWGEGKVDALAAVDAAPRGDTGVLTGTVTAADGGAPIAGATVKVEGPLSRTTTTGEDGTYRLTLSVGDYTVSVHAFGYVDQTAQVTVGKDDTTTKDFALVAAPSHSLSGTVTDARGQPVVGVEVTVEGTPLPPATTDEQGRYSFDAVPEGSYTVTVAGSGCMAKESEDVTVDGDKVVDFRLADRTDDYGYRCVVESADYIEGDTNVGLVDDDASIPIELPFRGVLYGAGYTEAYASTNGHLTFTSPSDSLENTQIPNRAEPNAAIYAFWDDLVLDDEAGLYTGTSGSAPNRTFVVEWRNALIYGSDTGARVDAEIVLHENGEIVLNWRNIDENDPLERGASATTGIEDADGTDGLQYSYNSPVLANGKSVRYTLPPNGFVTGKVTDRNDGNPVANATVEVLDGDTVVRRLKTDADGTYFGQVWVGDYTLRVSATNYVSQTAQVSVAEGRTVKTEFVLRTARAEVDSPDLSWVLPEGVTQQATFTISNTGSAPLAWEALESGGQRTAAKAAKVAKGKAKLSAADRNANARTAVGRYTKAERERARPTAAGDVLASWPVQGADVAWGVGFDGDVWISDPPNKTNNEFTTAGDPVKTLTADWAGEWNGDMAYDTRRGRMCQVDVGGDNGIYCWDRASGEVEYSLTGSPWSGISQRGLAYRADDDSFYIGGWNEDVLYHVAGASSANPGEVLDQCALPDSSMAGLAWNSTAGVLWVTTNSPTDDILEVDPNDCSIVTTLGFPDGDGFVGAGAELDFAGNLWVTSQASNKAFLVETGVPQASDVAWLSEEPSKGTIPVGGEQDVTVTVDTTGLEPGVYRANVILDTNSGRQRIVQLPVQVVVSGYWKGVNAGGAAYTDTQGLPWVADQQYRSGRFGWVGTSTVNAVGPQVDIRGTDDDPLYRDQRQGMEAYRFDRLPAGKYEVTMDFAELTRSPRVDWRMFDVDVDGQWALVGYDIADEVGGRRADSHSIVVDVPDGGTLQVTFHPRRSYKPPVINALRVVQRPDL
ncbi:Serine protease, subtilisin family [Actinopolymorpha cephalotaxi]|uniref:Serine protease, subtilisin family n=1 Tax=Actinopolymorpha cephalotaxi TaxID=504797 RepID=A0A1I2KVT4_9ACTN|nr:carboxypeptidase regulatory-like domain-containing protein [Actinopolymorpha cephalotaxi]SFF70439.1 Serine protease, subtilisin family [Actinopolymorpha cephalotaxi]